MPDDLTPTRRYTDREIQQILKEATENQAYGDHPAALSEGMSLAELEHVAIQAGIDPASVRRAAQNIDSSATPAAHSGFLGSSTKLVFDRVIEGTIDRATLNEMVDAARSVTREIGALDSVGGALRWTCSLDGAATELSVFGSAQRTTVRVTIHLNGTPLAVFMMKLALGVFGTLTLASGNTAESGVAGLVVGAGCYLWARLGLRRSAERYSARGQELLDAIVKRIGPPGA